MPYKKFLIPKAEYSQVVSAMNHHLELPLTFERCSSQRLKLVSFSCQNKVSQTMGWHFSGLGYKENLWFSYMDYKYIWEIKILFSFSNKGVFLLIKTETWWRNSPNLRFLKSPQTHMHHVCWVTSTKDFNLLPLLPHLCKSVETGSVLSGFVDMVTPFLLLFSF